jgi:hypothetical protein
MWRYQRRLGRRFPLLCDVILKLAGPPRPLMSSAAKEANRYAGLVCWRSSSGQRHLQLHLVFVHLR